MRISDWSSDVCSSDLGGRMGRPTAKRVMCAVSMGVLSGLPARGMAQGIPDAPRAGVAQEVDERKITVATRPKPELDPIGVRIGSFLLYPSIDLGLEFDDNVYRTEKIGSASCRERGGQYV